MMHARLTAFTALVLSVLWSATASAQNLNDLGFTVTHTNAEAGYTTHTRFVAWEGDIESDDGLLVHGAGTVAYEGLEHEAVLRVKLRLMAPKHYIVANDDLHVVVSEDDAFLVRSTWDAGADAYLFSIFTEDAERADEFSISMDHPQAWSGERRNILAWALFTNITSSLTTPSECHPTHSECVASARTTCNPNPVASINYSCDQGTRVASCAFACMSVPPPSDSD